jgi:multimeric flavodoxin WrbA
VTVPLLTAVAFNCTLKRSPEPSSCGLLLSHFAGEFGKADVPCEIVRVADFDVEPGVSSDEGAGDEWPALRAKVLAADIFVMGTPIWLGHPSSICQRVLERFDAFLSEEDDAGRMITYDKVAVCAVVGNEDGAHHVNAEVYQGLADVGFTIPASGSAYWIGEAYGDVDYKDFEEPPEKTAEAVSTAVRQAVHLARTLREAPYP